MPLRSQLACRWGRKPLLCFNQMDYRKDSFVPDVGNDFMKTKGNFFTWHVICTNNTLLPAERKSKVWGQGGQGIKKGLLQTFEPVAWRTTLLTSKCSWSHLKPGRLLLLGWWIFSHTNLMESRSRPGKRDHWELPPWWWGHHVPVALTGHRHGHRTRSGRDFKRIKKKKTEKRKGS